MNTDYGSEPVPRGEEMLAYGVTALLLEPVLNELVEEAGLPRTRRPDHQELEQVVVGVVHFFHSEIHIGLGLTSFMNTLSFINERIIFDTSNQNENCNTTVTVSRAVVLLNNK